MNVNFDRTGVVSQGLSAYARQARAASWDRSASQPAGLPHRKTQTFSLGPFTLRYEEESLDLDALASAAREQLDRVRRFNFREALQAESQRAEGPQPDAAAAEFPVHSQLKQTETSEAAVYGPDARVRSLLAGSAEKASPGKGEPAAGQASGSIRARQALKAYLAALELVPAAPSPDGRLYKET